MIKADYHIHSNFSHDSTEKIERIIEEAIRNGLEEIAITDHYDPNYPSGFFDLDVISYIEILKSFRLRMEGVLKIKIGIELGLRVDLKDDPRVKNIYNNDDIDFIIGSTHTLGEYELDKKEFFQMKSKDEAHREYFEGVYENIKSSDHFNVCGHLDFIRRYGEEVHQDYHEMNYEKHKDIIDKILIKLIESKQGIEVNSSGFAYIGIQHPNDCILRRYKELGGTIITIGSDAHRAEHLTRDFHKIVTILKNCGFKFYCTFDKKKPIFNKI